MSSKRYAFVPMDDGPAPEAAPKSKSKSESRRHRSGSLRRHKPNKYRRRDERRDDDDQWGDEEVSSAEEEEEEPARKPKRRKLSLEPDDGDLPPEVRDELESKAANEFALRMREKDSRTSKRDDDDSAMRRRRREEEERRQALPDIREKSRQEYLQKRKTEKLALFRKQINEEQAEIRSGTKLSRAERAEFAENLEKLRLMEERERLDDHREGYYIPETHAKEDALNERYVEKDEYGREKHVTEHDRWEQEQAAKVQSQIKRDGRTNQKEYDFLMDEDQWVNWKQDARVDGTVEDPKKDFLNAQIDAEEKKHLSIQETRKSLPIYKHREGLLDAIEKFQVLIIVGETGSGKTTQLPQYLHEAGYTKDGMKVGCTQPRRVAAMSVAARVADEMGVKIGREVGYSIRFEDCTSDKTILKYMTDGMLLRELMTDPELSNYSAVMIDEAHERTVATDILLALVKDLARARPDLKLLISSATMDAEAFAKYFDDAPIYKVPGRRFPVDIHFTSSPEANYLSAAIVTVFQIHISQGKGDILVFLTGQDEIESAEQRIQDAARDLGNRIKELIICPIYANLPSDRQARIFEPAPEGSRKVVLATNIAETSLTIDGIVYVIDPGFVKENSFNPKTGMSSLTVVPCSRASAGQRAGRAGRVGPGKCFRLYTKFSYMSEMDESTTPEIQRTNLNGTVLQLKALGIDDVLNFDYMNPPPLETLMSTVENLYALQAFNSKGALTKLGRQMAEFPMEPAMAKAVIASGKEGCVEEVVSIVAMLGEASALFFRPKNKQKEADSARERFTVKEGGDHLTLLNIFIQWIDSGYSPIWARENFLQQRSLTRARDVRDQLMKLVERVEIAPSSCGASNLRPIKRALSAGFFQNAARITRSGDSYRPLKKNGTVYIHPSSVCFNSHPPVKTVIFHELVLTTKEYMRSCMPIEIQWLTEMAPHLYKKDEMEKYEERRMPKSRR
ncbi:pre-mRNA-splicing factor ATP-dependent RNA helicase PRP16 [Zalerion maritima]|uniref:RNA helicase n=1 Tax=Zalerion maritima TaxID=339359 RepID=A0AAD5RXK7_9PEZI|nr:pre-mRNA-splicing factor ATP-dependent RNA helicase PRP16 [Zalerion maritima]